MSVWTAFQDLKMIQQKWAFWLMLFTEVGFEQWQFRRIAGRWRGAFRGYTICLEYGVWTLSLHQSFKKWVLLRIFRKHSSLVFISSLKTPQVRSQQALNLKSKLHRSLGGLVLCASRKTHWKISFCPDPRPMAEIKIEEIIFSLICKANKRNKKRRRKPATGARAKRDIVQ